LTPILQSLLYYYNFDLIVSAEIFKHQMRKRVPEHPPYITSEMENRGSLNIQLTARSSPGLSPVISSSCERYLPGVYPVGTIS